MLVWLIAAISSILALTASYRCRRLMVDPKAWSGRPVSVFGSLTLMWVPFYVLILPMWLTNYMISDDLQFIILPNIILASYVAGYFGWKRLGAKWRQSPLVKIAGVTPIVGPIFLFMLWYQECK
jgi:hypothetical protein